MHPILADPGLYANRRTGSHAWRLSQARLEPYCKSHHTRAYAFLLIFLLADIQYVDARGNFLGPNPNMSWLNGIMPGDAYYRAFGATTRSRQVACWNSTSVLQFSFTETLHQDGRDHATGPG